MSENPVIRKSYNIMEEVVTELGREIIRQAKEIEIQILTTEWAMPGRTSSVPCCGLRSRS